MSTVRRQQQRAVERSGVAVEGDSLARVIDTSLVTDVTNTELADGTFDG